VADQPKQDAFFGGKIKGNNYKKVGEPKPLHTWQIPSFLRAMSTNVCRCADKRIENEEKYDAHHDQTPTWNHNAFP